MSQNIFQDEQLQVMIKGLDYHMSQAILYIRNTYPKIKLQSFKTLAIFVATYNIYSEEEKAQILKDLNDE